MTLSFVVFLQLLALASLGSRARADDWPSRGLDPAHQHASQERSGSGFGAGSWSYPVPNGSWEISTPAVADGIAVFGARDGSVHAIRATSGRRIWQIQLADGVVASPAIQRGRAFVPSLDGHLYALRLTDGAILWKRDLGGVEQSSPTVVGQSVIVAGGYPARKLFKIDAATGASLWETAPEVMAQFSNSAAVSDGDQVLIGAMGGGLHSFDLATGAHRWTYQADGTINLSAPAILGGRAYLLPGGTSGLLHAVDLANGKAVPGWPVELPDPPATADTNVTGKLLERSFAVSSLTVAAGRLVIDVRTDDSLDTNADGAADQFSMRESVISLDPSDGHVSWQKDNGHRVVASLNETPKNWLCPTPAAYQDLKTQGALLAVASSLVPAVQVLDAASGALLRTVALVAPSRISPVLANGRLIVGGESGVIQGKLSSSNQPPDPPSLTGGALRSIGTQGAKVHWAAALDPEGDSVSYQVRADRDGEILQTAEIDLTTPTGATFAVLPGSLQAGATYLVAVRARDRNGAWSDWSQAQYLRAVESPEVSIGDTPRGGLGEALGAAVAGDIVRLGAGTFFLSETLRVPPGVSLQGAGPQRTILDGTGLAVAVSLDGTAEGVPTTLQNLTVAGAKVGIAVGGAHDARMTHIVVRDNWDAGIDVGAAGAASLTNGTVAANGRGVRCFGQIAVRNSLVYGNQTGYEAGREHAISSRYNDVTGNGVALVGTSSLGDHDITRDVAFVNYPRRDLNVARGQGSTDQGDPADDFSQEPAPNGGRINLGAFGGTEAAELSGEAPKAPVSPTGAGCSMTGQTGAGVAATAGEMISVLAALGGLALLGGAARRRSRRRWAAALGFALVATVAAQSSVLANACVWSSSTTANWSASGSWTSCGSTTPQAADTVTFNSTKLGSCTVDANVTVTSITVSTGYTGTITQSSTRTITTSGSFSQAAGTFAGNNADITVGGSFSLSGTASFTSTSTILTIGGTFAETGSASFVHHSGTVLMTSTAASNAFASNGATFNNLVINDGLIGYWKLDDASSPSVDSSGYGNNASWVGTPVASATVPSVHFSDSGSLSIDSADDYATFTSEAATAVTVTAWIKATASAVVSPRILETPAYILSFNVGTSTPDNPMSLGFTSNRPTDGDWRSPSNSVSYGSWYHVAVTYDSASTSNLPSFYVNGAAQVSATVKAAPSGVQVSNAGPAYIGNRLLADRHFNGNIDDLRTYNRVLSAAEIAALAAGDQPNSSVATQTVTGDPIIAGDLVIASGTLAGGNTAIHVAGNWWNYGGLFSTGATGSVTFDGSTSGKSIRASQSDFNTLNIAGTGSWTLVDTQGVTIDKDLAISGGTLTSTSGVLEVQGAFNKTGGTFTHNSGTVLLSSTTSQTFASNGATFNNLAVNDGLIGYWKLDDASSPSVDSSGHGNHATWVGTPVASGTVPSVNFANPGSLGIDSADDYAAFPSSAATLVTIAVWVKATAAGAGCCPRIVDMPGYQIYFNTGSTAPDNPMSLSFVSVRSPAANSDWKTPSNSVTFGSWYHFAVTYDSASTSNLPTFYVNGAFVATTVKAAPPMGSAQPSNAGTGYIGNRNPPDRYFNGLIDDLRIYDRALSASEINSLYIGNQAGTGLGTQTLTGNPIIAGDLVIGSGTLAAGTNTVTVGGNWLNVGGLYTTGASGSVVFNGSASTNTILSGGSTFQDVSVTGSGTWTLADRMEIDPARSLTTTAGGFNLSSRTLRAGDVNRNGAVTITPSTGTLVLDARASQTLDTGAFYKVRIEPVAATNLVGYWKLDAGQGVTVKDYSGNGNDGTLTNGPTWVDSGLPPAITFDDPGAVTFSGASSQYVTTASPLPAVLQPAVVTMAGWYKATTVDAGGPGGEIVSGSDRYSIRVISNTSVKVIKQTATSTWINLAGTVSNALDGNWHHLAGVVSSSGMTLYFDGASVASNADTTAIDYSASGLVGLNIGRDPISAAYDFTGTIDDVRVYNTALTLAQIAALASGTYPAGLAGTPTYTLGNATTVSGALSIDNGTLATSSFTLSAASAGGSAATVSSGTYSVGSATSTFPGGLTVNQNGTLDLPTSGGVVEIGTSAQTQVLTIDGTLSAASTGAIIRKVTGANNFTFKVGSSASATPIVNITGLQVKNTDTNGMYINAVSGSTTTFTRFDNIAFSAGTGARLLQIYAPSLYLVSNGCSFDSGASSGTTTRNVTLRGDGSATETRAVFGGATCLNGSNPSYTLCEANDDDDDSGADGVGDTTATNAAVIQWTHAALADTSGTIEGFPTAAFDWNTFTYYSTYVMFHDVNSGTTDRIYVRDTNGNFNFPSYYWDSPSGVDLVGGPRYDTVSSVHYVYVATTTGKVYRLIDNTTSHTLTQDNTGSWAGASNPFDCACTISTPLTLDTNNIYWGGTASAANKVWSLVKSTRTLVSGTNPVTVTAVVSGAAPSWYSSSIFMGSLAHIYRINTTAQTLTTDYAPTAAGNMNGRISIINSKVYGADDKGNLWVVDPATASASTSTVLWSYQDPAHAGCTSGSVCAITSSLYVDPALSRVYYGDSDGHLYSSYNSSGTTGAQRPGFPYRPGTSSEVYGSAPLYRSGILVAGTTTGNVYFIDANAGSAPALIQTYKFGSSTKISGIAYDSSSSSYMISTSNAASKDGKLIYIDAMSDPTPGSI